jgi:hypothetical protein
VQREFNIYPNPSNNIINISSSSPIYTIEVYDNLGQKIQDTFFNDFKLNFWQLNLANNKSGVYIIKCFTKDGIRSQKIILD